MANNKIQTAVQQQKMENVPKKILLSKIDQMAPAIKAALPSVITPERFTRMVLSAISSNPKLQICEPNSFLGAMMQAAQLGLEPNTPLGQAYIVPRRIKGVWKAQFEFGYKGMIDLAYRSNFVSAIDAQVVYENDFFEYEFGLEPKLRHKPALSNRGKPIQYYAIWRSKDGAFGFQVMSKEDCEEHARKHSDAYNKSDESPWHTEFNEMAKKTVLKSTLKYAPMKSDFSRQIAADETIKSVIEENMVDLPTETYEETDYVTVDENTGEVTDPAALPEPGPQEHVPVMYSQAEYAGEMPDSLKEGEADAVYA